MLPRSGFRLLFDRLSTALIAMVLVLLLPASALAQPANDLFEDRITISGFGTVTGNNIAATAEDGQPRINGWGGIGIVWWSYTATQRGRLTIDTCGSSIETVLGVFTGSALTQLSGVVEGGGATDCSNGERATFHTEAGVTYVIGVAGSGAEGAIRVTVGLVPTPANDLFEDRITIAHGNTYIGNNIAATAEDGQPRINGWGSLGIVWWSYRAPRSEYVDIQTCGSGTETVLGVFTGSALTQLSGVVEGGGATDCSNGERATFHTEAGATYVIGVAGGGSEGHIVLSVSPPARVETTTTLVGPTSSTRHDTVELIATVSAPTGTPTGRVSFRIGSQEIADGTLNAQGVVRATISTLLAGQHQIAAVYHGAPGLQPSGSPFLTLTVAPSTNLPAVPPEQLVQDIPGRRLLGDVGRPSASSSLLTTERLGGDFDRSLPTVIVTHGWQRDGEYGGEIANIPFIGEMWQNLNDQFNSPERTMNVLGYTWEGAFNALPGPPQQWIRIEGEALAAELHELLGGPNVFAPPLHFIGHSYGAAVNAIAVQRLARLGYSVDHVTILDLPYTLGYYHLAIPLNTAIYLSPGTYFENYFGTRPTSFFVGTLGHALLGTAPVGGYAVAGDHRGVWKDFYAPSVLRQDTSPTEGGFFYSAALGSRGAFSRRPLETLNQMWGYKRIRASYFAGLLQNATVDPVEQTAIIWGIPDNWDIPEFQINRPRAATTTGDGFAVLEVAVPRDAFALELDVHFAQPGDGDWLEISFGGTLLGVFEGRLFTEEGENVTLGVSDYAGQIGHLSLHLVSRGTTPSEVAISNLQFLSDDSEIAVATATMLHGPEVAQPGQPLTFTATVTAETGAPDGHVSFMRGDVAFANVALDAGGVASASVASFPVGSHQVRAEYLGSNGYESSTSTAMAVRIVARSETSLIGPENIEWPEGPTYVARVRSDSGQPLGTVSFQRNGTQFATRQVSSDGTATLSNVQLPVGTHQVSAVYLGSPDYFTSVSPEVQTNIYATPNITIGGPATLILGEGGAFTATVASPAGTVPGNVRFRSNGTQVAVAPLTPGGTATAIISAPNSRFTTGTLSLVAEFLGSGGYRPVSSSELVVTIRDTATTTELTGPDLSQEGTDVTFEARVSSALRTPIGTVRFERNGSLIGLERLEDGHARVVLSDLPIGSHRISAIFMGALETARGSTAFSSSRSLVLEHEVTALQPNRVVQIAAGRAHSCALLATQEVYCWGANADGQLGDATRQDRWSPALVEGLERITSITAGGNHTCAVALEGNAYCWGSNEFGQLGDGTTINSDTPVSVRRLTGITMLTAGRIHSCGVDRRGRAYCWGGNGAGQLGDGSAENRSRPVRVHFLRRVSILAAGGEHSCAIRSDTQRAYCWEGNQEGQLGNGTTIDNLSPVRVAGRTRFSALTAGAAHTCALDVENNIVCWGQDSAEQLDRVHGGSHFTPAANTPLGQANSIAAGNGYSCAILADHRTQCWSNGENVQSGGQRQDDSLAASVLRFDGFSAVAVGDAHACGIDAAERVQCWGQNANGQLGDGTNEDRREPVEASFLHQSFSHDSGAIDEITGGP